METTAMAAPAGGDKAEEPLSLSPLDLRHAPLLLFDGDGKSSDDGHDGIFLLYSIPSRQVLRRRVGEMKDHRYWTTPQGWVLMAARGGCGVTFLWDPFTAARISLAPDRDGFLGADAAAGPKRCLVSCKCKSPVVHHDHPSRSSCVVLVMDLADTVFWYWRLGDGEDDDDGDRRWLKHEYGNGTAGGEIPGSVLWSMSWSLVSVVGGDDSKPRFLMDVDGTDKKVVTLEFSPEPWFTVIPVEAAGRTAGRHKTALANSRG